MKGELEGVTGGGNWRNGGTGEMEGELGSWRGNWRDRGRGLGRWYCSVLGEDSS